MRLRTTRPLKMSWILRGLRYQSPELRGALFYFFVFAITGAYEPFLTVYLAEMGLDGKEIGVLSAFFPLMSLVAAPIFSRLADQRGVHRAVLVICLAGQAIGLGILQIPKTFLGMLPLILVYAIFRSPIQPISDSLIVRMAIRHNLSYGKIRQWGSVSFATVSLISGIVWKLMGYEWMFFAASVLSLLVIIPSLWLEPHDQEEQRKKSVGRGSMLSTMKNPLLLVLVLATFLVGAALGIGRTFESVYINYLGGNRQLIGAFYAISAYSEIPAMVFARWILRRLNGKKILILAYTFILLAYIGYSLAQEPEWMLLLVVLKGVGFGLFFVTTVGLIDEIAPGHWKATAQSVVVAAGWGLGPLLATLVGGVVFDVWGPASVFLVNAGLVAVAIILFLATRFPQKETQPEISIQ